MKRYMLFNINDQNENFGIDMFSVVEVIFSPEITKPPRSVAKYCKGMFSYRGLVVPVICVNERFGLEPQDKYEYMVVIQHAGHKVALLASSVMSIIEVTQADLKEDDLLTYPEYMEGVAESKGKLVQLIDIGKLLDEMLQLTTNQERATKWA